MLDSLALFGWKRITVNPSATARIIAVHRGDGHRAGGMGVITGVLERGLQVSGGAQAIRGIVIISTRGVARCGLIGGDGGGWPVVMDDCLQAIPEQK